MKVHKVKSGECLSSIAYAYGFKVWETVYNAPENAELKKKRPNPNLLYPGDEVVIPDLETKTETELATEKCHKFKVKGTKCVFRIQMRDAAMNPLVSYPYQFYIGKELIKEDVTKEEGLIEVQIPKEACSGKIHFLGETYNVYFGALDPVARVSGLQQRLCNLGYDVGPVDGILGPLTRKSIYEFQLQHRDDGLEPNGEIDDNTRALLQTVHDADENKVAFED